MGEFVTTAIVEDFLSAQVVRDTYDDDNDGAFDVDAVNRHITDAEALVKGSMRGVYQLPLVAPIDPLVVSATLQTVHCLAIRRHPERFRAKGDAICKAAQDLREDIRKGNVQLDHPLIETARLPSVDSFPSRGLESLERYVDCDDEDRRRP